AVFAIPRQCTAKTVTVRTDLTIAVNGVYVGFAMGVMDCYSTNQLAVFGFSQQSINTGLEFEDILVVIGSRGRETRFDAVMCAFDTAPDPVAFNRNARFFRSGI